MKYLKEALAPMKIEFLQALNRNKVAKKTNFKKVI